jgi:hypothetical protein
MPFALAQNFPKQMPSVRTAAVVSIHLDATILSVLPAFQPSLTLSIDLA